jgi:ubiquinone/menaquinone biosynthesis C-methylase UbiE
MLEKIGIQNKKITTYDKKDFYENWAEINKTLAQRWDSVIEFNPHHGIGKTLTDKYWVSEITRLLSLWLPRKTKGLKLLKYDLYNEATGTAEVTEWFLKKGFDFYGVDISKEVIKRARKNFGHKVKKSHIVLGDVRKLPFKDNTFDVVFSFGTIEHIRENATSVNEAFRVLKPGGIFITGINNKLDIWGSYFINEWTNKVYKHITSYEASFFPWQQREWLNQAGFEKIKTSGMIMFPHAIRYADLLVEWKVKNKFLKTIWKAVVLSPFMLVAKTLDRIDFIRFFAMHTTSYGHKPAK